MWSNCFCFVLVTSSQLARQPVFQNLFGNFVYLLPCDVNKPQNGLFQKNSNMRGLVYNFLKTPLKFFIFLLYLCKFQTKQSSTPRYSTKLCQIPQKFQGQKQRPMEIPHYFFLLTLGNFTWFLINPQKFHVLFL